MREVLRRLLTGVVYVLLLLSAVFLSSDAYDFLFMVFGLACLYEYKRLVLLKGYYIFLGYLALWWVFIYLTRDPFLIQVLLLLTIGVNVGLIVYLFKPKKRSLTPFRSTL